jgi:hypothetical protein
MGWTTEGSEFDCRYGQEFSLLNLVQTGSAVHPTSYSMGIGAFSRGVKRPGREADHSPPTNAEVRKMLIRTSTPPYTSTVTEESLQFTTSQILFQWLFQLRTLIQFRNHFSQTVGLFGRVISPSQGRYLNTGQHKHRINAYTPNIHALSGIRTHDPSVRASEDS